MYDSTTYYRLPSGLALLLGGTQTSARQSLNHRLERFCLPQPPAPVSPPPPSWQLPQASSSPALPLSPSQFEPSVPIEGVIIKWEYFYVDENTLSKPLIDTVVSRGSAHVYVYHISRGQCTNHIPCGQKSRVIMIFNLCLVVCPSLGEVFQLLFLLLPRPSFVSVSLLLLCGVSRLPASSGAQFSSPAPASWQ